MSNRDFVMLCCCTRNLTLNLVTFLVYKGFSHMILHFISLPVKEMCFNLSLGIPL